MSPARDGEPSVGELFDYIERSLGIGSYDASSREPFWRYRTRQVARLRRLLTKQGRSTGQVWAAVDHAKRTRQSVIGWEQLCALVPEAMAASRTEGDPAFEAAYAAAIAVERNRPGGSAIYARLVRARGPYRREVYAQWLQANR